jgi:DNA-directed RNA polymerase specialized sigma24 family protein
MLAFTLDEALRHVGRGKREAARESSQEQKLEQSSIRPGSWLAVGQPSPSADAVQHEEAVRVAGALAELPDANREAVVMRY